MRRRVLLGLAALIVLTLPFLLHSGEIDSLLGNGNLRSVAHKLGIDAVDGSYSFAELLEAVTDCCGLAIGARQTVWCNESTAFNTDEEEFSLRFRTEPGAICYLYVAYLGTGRASTSPKMTEPKQADSKGYVSWSWSLDAEDRQSARIMLMVEYADGERSWDCWCFDVLSSNST